MKALILAAGIGQRLGELTKDIPKCLLPIDSSTTLLDYSLQAISDNGFSEVIFITGHAEDKLKDHIEKKWKNKFKVSFIFNDRYSEFNNIYSAYLAKDIWDDETILFNSDIIFHPDILENLLTRTKTDCHASLHSARNDMNSKSYLVIHDKKILNAEDMKVRVNKNNEIKEINKGLDISTSYGEYIGILYLRGLERIKLLESLEKNIQNKRLNIYYEDALDDVLSEITVFPCSTEGKIWTEVDTKEDYELAKKIAKEINCLYA